MKKIIHNNIAWIDIQDPQQTDLDFLIDQYRLHPFITTDFLPFLHRPKIDEFPEQLFLVLHFPVYDKKNSGEVCLAELDIILSDHTLITSHKEEISSLQEFFEDCDVQDYHKKQFFKSNGYLALSLLDFMIDSCLPMLDKMAEDMEKIEKNVFSGKEKEMLTEIARIKRDLIDFRRAVKPQRSVLEILEKKLIRLFGKQLKPVSQEVIGSNIRVWNVLENLKDSIEAIEQTNNSLLSYKLSDIMKVLTIVSFITFPLTVITGFFGMNVFGGHDFIQRHPSMPILILIFMLILAVSMFAYFKRKKWL